MQPVNGSKGRLVVNITFPPPLPRVPEGDYTVAYVKHEYKTMFAGQPKLILTFRIIEMGEYFGTEVQRFYNVRRLAKSYRPLPKADLTREMQNVFGVRSLDGISILKELKKSELIVEIRDVKTSSRQEELTDLNSYSLVAKVKGKAR